MIKGWVRDDFGVVGFQVKTLFFISQKFLRARMISVGRMPEVKIGWHDSRKTKEKDMMWRTCEASNWRFWYQLNVLCYQCWSLFNDFDNYLLKQLCKGICSANALHTVLEIIFSIIQRLTYFIIYKLAYSNLFYYAVFINKRSLDYDHLSSLPIHSTQNDKWES